MANEKKLEPTSNAAYNILVWVFKIVDLFRNPQQRVKGFPLKEGMVVVDLGCGPGRYTLPVAKSVGPKGRVFAVDIQPLAISAVKEKAARESLTNIEAILVDSYYTGIQDSSADLVLLLDTLHLIGDHHALFREIHRLLRQNGILFMDPGHMKVSKAREILEGTGFFKVVEYRGRDMLVAPKDK